MPNGSAFDLLCISVPVYIINETYECFFIGRAVLDGAVGHRLAQVAGRVRERELGLSPLAHGCDQGV